MTSNEPAHAQDEGYRYVLPKRTHPFQRFLTSRCIVEATPWELRVFESFGPIKQNWAHSWNRQARFAVEEQAQAAGQTWALRVDLEGNSVLIGTGYPKAKLEELESNLRSARDQWMGSDAAPRELPVQPSPASVAPMPPASDSPAETDVPPATMDDPAETTNVPLSAPGGLPLSIQPTPDGVHVGAPPVGVGRGTHGLLPFGLLVVVLPLPFLLVSITDALFGGGLMALLEALPGFLGFGVLSAAVLVPIWNVGTRSTILTVDGDNLRIMRKSIFGAKSYCYPRADVTDVRAGNSTVQVNGKFIKELHVFVNDRKVVGILFERTEEEIERAAHALLAALSTPPAGA